jgi:hypothetical protein
MYSRTSTTINYYQRRSWTSFNQIRRNNTMTNHAINLDVTNVTLVPDAKPDGKNVGMQVFWRLTGNIDQEAFDTALSAILPTSLLPAKSRTDKYLKRALEAVRGSRSSNLVRKVEEGKFSIVKETRDLLNLELEGEHDSAYNVTVNACVVTNPDGSQFVKITPEGHPQAEEIRSEFERQRMLYSTGSDISQWLTTKVINHIDGVSARERGGTYFLLSQDSVAKFNEIAEAMKSVSKYDSSGRLIEGIKVYRIPCIMNDDLAESVVDSITEEAEALLLAVNEKVEEDDMTLRGWAGQRREILKLQSKVSKLGNVLGVGFDNIFKNIEEVNTSIGYLEAKLAYQEEEAANK